MSTFKFVKRWISFSKRKTFFRVFRKLSNFAFPISLILVLFSMASLKIPYGIGTHLLSSFVLMLLLDVVFFEILRVARKRPVLRKAMIWLGKHVQSGWRPISSSGITVKESTTSNLPPNFGVSGYNIAGIYTGSTTSVGGISD